MSDKITQDCLKQAELVKKVDPELMITGTYHVFGEEVLVQGRHANNGRGISNYWVTSEGVVYNHVNVNGKLERREYEIQ